MSREQNVRSYDLDILVKDQIDFSLYPNWLGRSTLVVPRHLEYESLDDLTSSYVNRLLKDEFGVELKNREDWFSEQGKKIISSFLLTEQAKKFLIAKHLHSIKHDNIFSYFSLATIAIYVPFQLIKWQRELVHKFLADRVARQKAPNNRVKEGFFRYFFLKHQRSTRYFVISSFLYLTTVLYFAIGLKNSRDSDALALSRGLAYSLTIKSKTSLMDFNYYSGGEEAYKKMSERNHCINKLFFDGMGDLERFYKRIPLTKNGNQFNILGNRVPIQTAYENLNDWEKNSV